MTARLFFVGLVTLLASGCDPGTIFCGPTAMFAVQVEVVDAETGRPAAEGATLVIRDGAYVDSTSISSLPEGALPLLLAGYERPGTYDVVVRRPDYREWQRQGVVARRTGGICRGLDAARLEARLEPLGSS